MLNKTYQIDLGSGSRKKEGFLGLDVVQFPGVDIICDLRKGLPFKDESIHEVHASHILEHLDFADFDALIHEIHRVCTSNALVVIRVPHFSSFGAGSTSDCIVL